MLWIFAAFLVDAILSVTLDPISVQMYKKANRLTPSLFSIDVPLSNVLYDRGKTSSLTQGPKVIAAFC